MYTHPDLVWAQMKQHHRDLIAEADTSRLLAAARRARRARSARGHAGHKPVARGAPAGNLAPCEPPVAAPAR
jgi:hypothetical protein